MPLSMPKIGRGSGRHQAEACLTTINEWGIHQQIRGLVFDTTATSTRLKNGACTFIEHSLDRRWLGWLAGITSWSWCLPVSFGHYSGQQEVQMLPYSKGFRLAGRTLTSQYIRLLLITCLIHVLLSFELRW